MESPSRFRRLAPSHLLGWWLAALLLLLLPTAVSAGFSVGFASTGQSMKNKNTIATRCQNQPRLRRHSSRKPKVQRPAFQEQGTLFEKPDGTVVLSESADVPFNPASAIKLATTLFALRQLGPDYQFVTDVWTNGTIDAEGVLHGNIYLSGNDLSLRKINVREIATLLKRAGIVSIKGKIFATPTFTVDFQSAAVSASLFKNVLMEETIVVAGGTTTGAVPARATLVASHQSARLVNILKVMLCYSSNYMAERIGAIVGGPAQLQKLLIAEGIESTGLRLASTSGLGVNRVTPRAMMIVLRALVDELGKHSLTLTNILPVAGVDPGTLSKRYQSSPARGSLAAKTGTLIRTDGGASALVGVVGTGNGGKLYFVIFHRRGHVPSMRARQDQIIAQVQTPLGGPSLLDYLPHPLLFTLGHA